MPNWKSAVIRLSQARRRIQSRRPSPAAPARMEPLEPREMMSVTRDAAGWTVVTPSAGDRVVYVSSSSGNDGNSGLSPVSPVKTLKRGESLLRGGTGDELLLKRGDIWHESFGIWSKGGASAQRPMVFGAYGAGARPALYTGTTSALVVGGPPVNYFDVIGIKMYADGHDPKSGSFKSTLSQDGIAVDSSINNWLIEDCDIQSYKNNITFQKYLGPMQNVTIRRCVIADAYSYTSAHSQGLFADGIQGLTLEDNVFDHNGWSQLGAGQAIFNHDAYVAAGSSGLVARDNIFADASSHGLQARCGGVIVGNVFLNDGVGLSFGLVNGAPLTAGGVSGSVSGNAFIGSHMVAGQTKGIAVEVGNVRAGAGATISGNIFTQNPIGKNAAISMGICSGNANGKSGVGLNDVHVVNNIVYKWYAGIAFSAGMHSGGSGTAAINRVSVAGNVFQQTLSRSTGAVYSGVLAGGTGQVSHGAYRDPSRTADTYDRTIGGSGSLADFIARARTLSHQNWNTSYTAAALLAYIQAGFV